MAFADYTDGTNTVRAIHWDGTQAVADEVIYQIPGISVHVNTIGEVQIKELRFNNFLVVPEGYWLVIEMTTDSVTALRLSDTDFNAAYTII